METIQSYETDQGNCSTSLDDNRTLRYGNRRYLLKFGLDQTQIHYVLQLQMMTTTLCLMIP